MALDSQHKLSVGSCHWSVRPATMASSDRADAYFGSGGVFLLDVYQLLIPLDNKNKKAVSN
jgi:hypothetical protein